MDYTQIVPTNKMSDTTHQWKNQDFKQRLAAAIALVIACPWTDRISVFVERSAAEDMVWFTKSEYFRWIGAIEVRTTEEMHGAKMVTFIRRKV